jgi:hypothetical protein
MGIVECEPCVQIRSVFQRQQLVFNGDARLAVMHFLQGTITSAATVIVLGEEGGTEAGRATVEAVAALGQFLQQALNGGLFTMDEVSELVVFLSALIQFPVPPQQRPSSSALHGNSDEMEAQRLTFLVLGSLLSQSRPLVSSEAWTRAVQVRSV